MEQIIPLDQRLALAGKPTTLPTMIPAPVKGWNTRDALDAMDPLDAVQLDNWFPDSNGVSVRNGYQSFATGLGSANVETLAEYDAAGTRKFIAACSGSIFDISAGGIVGAPLKSGFGSNRWQTTNFLSRTFLVNGVDKAQIYDGATVADASFTGSGLDLTKLYGVWQYQQRLFFWETANTGFWYAQLNSISGTLAFYDLSAFCPLGGNLVAVTNITHDGGNGVLDFVVFIMSSGESLVFYGNDPGNAANWQLVGAYRISPPVNVRAVANYGGDSFLTTFDDHVPLQQQLVALKVGAMAPRSKVSTAVQEAVQLNKSAFGWQALYYPRGRRLIFNIPNSGGTFDQHICNTGLTTQPWCRFVGMNALCWGLFQDFLYFGGANGTVYLADTGNLDVLGPVMAAAQQAWNTLDSAFTKRCSAVRPLISRVGAASISFAIGFDYQLLDVPIPIVTPDTGSPWNISPWNTSPWSQDQNIDPEWFSGVGTGTAIGFGMTTAATRPLSWLRTDFRLEQGIAL